MFNPVPVVLADFRRNRILVAVTLALVAVAVALGIAVIAQERAIRQGSARAAEDFDILIGAPGSPTQLVLTSIYLQVRAIPLLGGEVVARVAATKGVRYAAPIAFGDSYQGYPIIGTTADFVSRGGQLPMQEGRLMVGRGEAVVGASVKLALGAQFAPSHGMHHEADDGDDDDEHKAMQYTVVGRLAPRHNNWDNAIMVPVEDVWAVHDLPDGHLPGEARIGPPWESSRLPGVPALVVKPESIAAAYGLRNQFRGPDSMALFPAEVLNELYVTLGDVRDMMSFLAISTQILVVTAVLMALLVGFLARRRQFAVLRAIGASRLYVFVVIWCEVSLLILLGTLLGMGLGLAASGVLAAFMETKLGFAMPVSLGGPELALAASLVVAGLLVATVPGVLGLRRSISAGLKE